MIPLRHIFLASAALLVVPVLSSGEASAQDAVDTEETAEPGDIVVIATRIRGQVDADIPRIETLEAEDIATYGAGSINELLEALSPQTGSGRGRGEGRPVFLVNGQRIASFRQLRSIPPEAIRRMEILPEEAALRFGYPPDQRVVNFILKENFSTFQIAGEYNLPTRGGTYERELEAGLSRFDGPRRLNLNAKVEDVALLTEAERDLAQSADALPTVASDGDPSAFRSLIADSVTYTVDGSWSTGLGEEGQGGTLTIDGEASRSDSRSLSGIGLATLAAPDGLSERRLFGLPLERNVKSDTLEAGLTLNKPLGDWQGTATLDTTYSDTKTRTDRRYDASPLFELAAQGAFDPSGMLPDLVDPGQDRARSKLFTLSAFGSLSGSPFVLPAGEASLTVSAGFDYLDLASQDSRLAEDTSLGRKIYSTGANLALPLTERDGFGGALGALTLNLSAQANHFSDFGTLGDWSAGLIWKPLERLTLNATWIANEVAPSVGQLNNPVVENFNVPVFDLARGEDALVTVISGGNPFLLAEQQKDLKLSANYEVKLFRRSSILVEYFRNRSEDVTRSFPLLTPAVEAAFADRVTRAADGTLLAVDRRPVTFSQVESERVRWGINLSGQIEPDREGGSGGRGMGGRGRGGGEGGARPSFNRGPPGGRWNVSLYHTYKLADRVEIAPGVPVFDQLEGNALTDGGVPRHEIEFEGGVFHKGYGIRVRGNWFSSADVLSLGAPGSSDLRFGSVFDLGARIFVDLGQREKLVEQFPLLKGTRIALDFDNLLDSRQLVTDELGQTPFAYSRAFRDPRGRYIGIDIRKTF